MNTVDAFSFLILTGIIGGTASYIVLSELTYLRKRLNAVESQMFEYRNACINDTHKTNMELIDLKYHKITPITLNLIGQDIEADELIEDDLHLGDSEPVEVLTPVATAD